MNKQILDKIFRILIQNAKMFHGDVSIGKAKFSLNDGQFGFSWSNGNFNLDLHFDPSKARYASES